MAIIDFVLRMKKIVRAATVPSSLEVFCKDILCELSRDYEVLALSSPGQDLEKVSLREGVRTIGVPMERHISPWKDLIALCKIYKVLRDEKPDMVHSMTPKAGLLCMITAWLARVPVRVHTFTGLVWPTSTGFKRKILMMTDRITCACATHVIPEGYGVLNDLRDYGITKKPLKVLGYGNVMGVSLDYWRKSEELEVRSEEFRSYASDGKKVFTFLFVGRIVGDKGINELVKAFTKLGVRSEEFGVKCRLVMVGSYEDHLDPILPETRKLIDEIPEIEAVGPQYGEDLKAWYAAADCFVFPSYREGFPNTVLEAGAMELASIVTDINGSREIIGPSLSPSKGEDLSQNNQRLKQGEMMSIRENGVVIPSKDVDALYDAMLWMMEHEEERKAMGKRAREIVAERWEQGFVREKLYEFYREVLEM